MLSKMGVSQLGSLINSSEMVNKGSVIAGEIPLHLHLENRLECLRLELLFS